MLYLKNVPNPLYEVSPETIIVSTYDGLNKLIIDSSYHNLNPTTFEFQFPGPLIEVNNESPIYIMRGTMSHYIPVAFDYPCALDLTLISEVDS